MNNYNDRKDPSNSKVGVGVLLFQYLWRGPITSTSVIPTTLNPVYEEEHNNIINLFFHCFIFQHYILIQTMIL